MAAENHRVVSFPRLDALRALCFLSVFFYHAFYTTDPAIRYAFVTHILKGMVFANGILGVNVFFVLSGFLITYLLIVERQVTGRVHVPRFWTRRVLRIWPLYYTCVAFGFIVFPWLKQLTGEVPNETAELPYFLFFASNFDPHLPDAASLMLLWSIAVEEQFYLLWPVLLALLTERHYPWLFVFAMVVSWVFIATHPDMENLRIHTLACIGDLATGALAAWLVSSDRGVARVRAWHPGIFIAAYLVFAVVYFMPDEVMGKWPVLVVFGRSLTAVPAALIILHQCFRPKDVLSLPTGGVLAYMGRISYGLYCLHIIAYLIAIQLLHRAGADTQVWQVILLQPTLALAICLGLAAASFRFLERPFLRLKERIAFVSRGEPSVARSGSS